MAVPRGHRSGDLGPALTHLARSLEPSTVSADDHSVKLASHIAWLPESPFLHGDGTNGGLNVDSVRRR